MNAKISLDSPPRPGYNSYVTLHVPPPIGAYPMGNPILDTYLGQRLSPKQLASILGLNYKTIIAHYREFGGVCIGRRYFFFEGNVARALSQGKEMGGGGEAGGREEREGLPLEEKGDGLGGRHERSPRHRMAEDPFGLLDP